MTLLSNRQEDKEGIEEEVEEQKKEEEEQRIKLKKMVKVLRKKVGSKLAWY